MDDPSLLTGRSTFAQRRRQKKLGICKCGAIMHNEINCRKQAISLTKTVRLDFVKRGRVVVEDETPSGVLPGLVVAAYPQIKFEIRSNDKGANAPRHPSRSPEETPEFYVW